jgi:uncharacterized protein
MSDEEIVLRGHPGIGPVVEGEALVSKHGFSARYDVNRKTGVFSREAHDLYGQSVVGKVLVHPTAKGGVATAWALLDMRAHGTAPLAIIFGLANPIMAQGAALANLALMDRLDPDPLATIETGDWLRVDPPAGTVTVRKGGRMEPGDATTDEQAARERAAVEAAAEATTPVRGAEEEIAPEGRGEAEIDQAAAGPAEPGQRGRTEAQG